jgi:pilus assembly protein Flp/PilA
MRMIGLRNQFQRFCASESGTTAIEYAIIAAGIAVVLVAAVSAIGSSIKGTFTTVVTTGFN